MERTDETWRHELESPPQGLARWPLRGIDERGHNTIMKAIAIVAAAVLGSTCLAQYEDYFPDVPSNHWVYETLLKLHRENIIDSPLSLMFRGGRPPSRMDIANWTVHASSVMLERLESAEADTTQSTSRSKAIFLHLLAKETDNLAKMVFLFEPELKIRHIDAAALRRDMRSFPKRIERVAGVKLGDDPDGRDVPPADFANTPKNRWVYAALDSMLNHGILMGYRFPFPGQRRDDRHTKANESREVIAGAMIKTYEKLVGIYRSQHESMSTDFVKLKEAGDDLARIRRAINELSSNLKVLAGFDDSVSDLIRMTYIFADDIRKQDVDPEKMIRELKEILHGSPMQ